MRNFFNKIIKFFSIVTLICAFAAGGAWYYLFEISAKQNPGNMFSEEAISEVLKGESRVYYKDGENLLGTFFDVNHRLYVPYDSIPINIINGLVAGEDNNYFKHGGFDYLGFTRAVISNIKAKRFVQGGSTLTQQTAKNLFGRESRSVKAKWVELQNAIRLEHNFSKQKILEFYLNQFYVSGTGRGVGIASWYFFSKELHELTLKESAFIAGSVKGPSNYDSFIKRTPESKQKALEKAEIRARYILKRMFEEQYIGEELYQKAVDEKLNFSQGRFRFHLSSSLERIQDRLNSDEWQNIFDSLGVESWQDAQLRVVSAVDKNIQEANQNSVKENLSFQQLVLEGYNKLTRKFPTNLTTALKGTFAYGKVIEHRKDDKGRDEVILSFSKSKAKISHDQLIAYIVKDQKAVNLYNDPNLTKGYLDKRVKELLGSVLQKDEIVLVQLLESLPSKKPVKCALEVYPNIQGAQLVLDHGEVISSMNSFDNSDYDRISHALRQFGSSWKIPLYALALDYGWDLMDPLENTYNVFQHNTTTYIPNPDHKDKGDQVSVLWAATRSENIASIWLLMHLLDKLPNDKLYELAQELRHFPQAGEGEKEFQIYLRDSLGLVLNNNAKSEIEFNKAKESFKVDLLLDDETEKIRALDALLFSKPKGSYKRYPGEIQKLTNFNYADLKKKLDREMKKPQTLVPQPCDDDGRASIVEATDDSDVQTDEESEETVDENAESDDKPRRVPLWRKIRNFFSDCPDVMPIALDTLVGNFTLHDFSRLDSIVDQVNPDTDYLEFRNLKDWPEWRQSLAMHAFADFLKKLGIRRPIKPVMSMPLGSNDVTLMEMTTVFQSLLTGYVYKPSMVKDWGTPILIKEIYDFQGKLLYQVKKDSMRVVDSYISEQVAVMLRSVVENGTGRRALYGVTVKHPKKKQQLRFSVYGKTGTTNSYRNAAFLGGIPRWSDSHKAFSTTDGLVVGSYVGYDNNKPMKSRRSRIRLGGSNGALPQWISLSNEIIKIDSAAHNVDFLDLEYQLKPVVPFKLKYFKEEKMVDKLKGMVASDSSAIITIPILDREAYEEEAVNTVGGFFF